MTNNVPFKLVPYLKFSLIAIKQIDFELGEDDFPKLTESALIRGAELILEARGVINPLVVQRTNNIYKGVALDEDTPDCRYELLNGHFEYFCAVRAREIDRSLECIQAWIISGKNRESIQNQLGLFREDDNFIDPYFEMDFELVEKETELDKIFSAALEGKTLDNFFAQTGGI